MPQLSNGNGIVWIENGTAWGQRYGDGKEAEQLPLPTDYATADDFCDRHLGSTGYQMTQEMFIKHYMMESDQCRNHPEN